MIKQQRIDVTKLKQDDIHPDHKSKVVTVEDEEKGELKFLPVKKITGKSFRLVHDGKVAFIIEGTEENETTTIHSVEEFSTEKQALNRVKALGLELKEGAKLKN